MATRTNGNGSSRTGRLSETRFSLLEAEVGGIKSDLLEFRTEVRAFFQSRQPRWNVWVPSLAIILGGFWFVLNLQVTSSIKGVSDSVSRMEAQVANNTKATEALPALTAQNADSRRDREDLNKKYDFLLGKVAENDKASTADRAERRATEAEVETQIDAMAQSLGIQFANQQRLNADIQNALHDSGAKMPTAPAGPFYFPNISNRNHRKQ